MDDFKDLRSVGWGPFRLFGEKKRISRALADAESFLDALEGASGKVKPAGTTSGEMVDRSIAEADAPQVRRHQSAESVEFAGLQRDPSSSERHQATRDTALEYAESIRLAASSHPEDEHERIVVAGPVQAGPMLAVKQIRATALVEASGEDFAVVELRDSGHDSDRLVARVDSALAEAGLSGARTWMHLVSRRDLSLLVVVGPEADLLKAAEESTQMEFQWLLVFSSASGSAHRAERLSQRQFEVLMGLIADARSTRAV